MEKMKLPKEVLRVFFVMILCSGIVELFGQTNTGGKFPQLLFPDFNKGIVQMKTGKTNS